MFVDDVDRLADELPGERAALADQIRRAARSVAANIAEGHGRPSQRDFVRYLIMARGSLHEVESDLVRIRNQSLVPGDRIGAAQAHAPRIERLLAGLLRHLEKPQVTPHRQRRTDGASSTAP